MIFLRTNFSRLHFLIAIFSVSSFATGILTYTGILEYNTGMLAHRMFVFALLLFPTLFVLTHKSLKAKEIMKKLVSLHPEKPITKSSLFSKLPLIVLSCLVLIFVSGLLSMISSSFGKYFELFHIVLAISIPVITTIFLCAKMIKDLLKMNSVSSKP